MISSRNALASLENALAEIRRSEDGIAAALRSKTDEAARLRILRANSYKALAEVRLDSIRQGEVVDQIDTSEREALRILEQRTNRLGEVGRLRETVRQALDAAEKDRLEKVDMVESVLRKIDDLDDRVEKELESDKEWLSQKGTRERAVGVAKAADEKASGWERDLQEKGAPYRDDPLFMYLWNNGFGTSRYAAGFLARFFDRRIAHLIDFEAARRDYHTLNQMPTRLREHAKFVTAAAESESRTLEQIERRALEKSGIVDLEKALQQVHEAVTKAETLIAELTARFNQLEQEQKGLVDEKADADYQRAVGAVAEHFEREDFQRLLNDARMTRNREDDNIIRQIEAADEKIALSESQIEEARQAALDLARRRGELEQSRDRFYRSGYDDPLGGFNNGDVIGEVLGGILAGAARGRRLDDIFDTGFQPGRRSRGGFGGGIQFPSGPVQGPWTGGGSSGGRGGGFRTGGGF